MEREVGRRASYLNVPLLETNIFPDPSLLEHNCLRVFVCLLVCVSLGHFSRDVYCCLSQLSKHIIFVRLVFSVFFCL